MKHLRERTAWTQEHLAEAAQVSVRTVQRAEDGAMSSESATAIAGALDEPIEELLATAVRLPTIVPIVSYEMRRYRAEDCEGHVWTFAQPSGGL